MGCIVVRGGKAVLISNDYEKSLVESLDMIKIKSRSLMEEALKSHIYESHICMRASIPFVLLVNEADTFLYQRLSRDTEAL